MKLTRSKTTKETVEVRHAIAQAFEGIGGVKGMITWAGRSPSNRGLFYTKIYAKLIHVTLLADAKITSEDLDKEREALNQLLLGLTKASRETGQTTDAEPVATK
jgi:hypothetical protein